MLVNEAQKYEKAYENLLQRVIPELLADHVRREAERFVYTMERRLNELSQVKYKLSYFLQLKRPFPINIS